MRRARLLVSTSFSRNIHLSNALYLLAGVVVGWLLKRYIGHTPPAARSVAAAAAQTTSDVLSESLPWISELSGAHRCVVWACTETGDAVPVATRGGVMPPSQIGQQSPLTWVAREGTSMRLEPPPVWSEARRAIAVHVPDSTYVLTLELMDDADVSANQFDGLGIYLAGVLAVQYQLDRLTFETGRVAALTAALRAMPHQLETGALANELAAAGLNITGSNGAVLLDWADPVGRVIGCAGDAPEVGAVCQANETEIALAARAGSTLVRSNDEIGRMQLITRTERYRKTPRMFVAVPLKMGETVIALLAVWSEHGIGANAIEDLETLAPFAALQLRHARELVDMRTLAERDALTGLHNRGAFDAQLAAELARYERYARPLALIVLDIDHFKSVNDRFGHDAGDLVLKRVAEVVAQSLRNVDLAARLGGEEFVVMLPETGIEKGTEIAERIRRRIEEKTLEWRGQRIPVRVSAGVSAIPDCVTQPDALVRSADQALYASKNGGRNRVTGASRVH